MSEYLQGRKYSGLVIWKEWNRLLGLVNGKPSRLVLFSPEDWN